MVKPIKEQLADVSRAKAMTGDRLIRCPTYGVYLHAQEQLKYIEGLLHAGSKPTAAELKKVDIGLMAVKELEAADPSYADLLMEINYHLDALGAP